MALSPGRAGSRRDQQFPCGLRAAQGVWLAAVHRLPALLCEGPVAWRPWAGTGERLQAILTQKAHGGTQNCI